MDHNQWYVFSSFFVHNFSRCNFIEIFLNQKLFFFKLTFETFQFESYFGMSLYFLSLLLFLLLSLGSNNKKAGVRVDFIVNF